MKFSSIAALAAVPLMAASAQTILVHGHRGARAMRPENTIPAFEYAIKEGVDVLELDLGVTKDNVVVVSHDSILKPPICTGPQPEAAIRHLTLAELKQWDCGGTRNPAFERQMAVPGTRIPTLDEVFALASRGKFHFNIETKMSPAQPDLTPAPDEFVKLVLAVIRKHHLEARVILQSFDFRTLHAMHALAPEIRLAALYSPPPKNGGPPKSFVAIAQESGAKIVSPDYHLVTAAEVEAAHKAGLQVIPWTPNKAEDWDLLIAAGVDAIITDDPAALIAHLRKQ